MSKQSKQSKVRLTPRNEDYSKWYLDVATTGKLFSYSPTPGCITFLPKAVNIWEKIKAVVDSKLKALGVQNLLLPTLIPVSFFEKEKNHVEGFSPELAVVTHAGGKELSESLAFRPTSEVMFCDFFRDNLQSYRDLPMLYNQWVNVIRWEKRTRPFLRTAEFYWQEGHTIHENDEDAKQFAESILYDVYISTMREVLAIEGIAGEKSASERFAGAEMTMTYEPMMSNGWALQICTSHVLGCGFMKSFDVNFSGRDGQLAHPAYTSWGLSTRSIGGMISSHSDDKGLIIPPELSEYNAVLLPIYGKGDDEIRSYTLKIVQALGHQSNSFVPIGGQSFRAIIDAEQSTLIDDRPVRLGEKITDWERSGYPVSIQYGSQEMESSTVTVVSRVTGEKRTVSLSECQAVVSAFNADGQRELLERSRKRLIEKTLPCRTLDEAGSALSEGCFALYNWDKDPSLEVEIKERWSATTRCLPFSGQWTDSLLESMDGHQPVIIARAF